MFRKDVILKLGDVEREFRAAALAVAQLLQRSLDDPTLLRSASVVNADVRACRDNSEMTYLVRMLAVFGGRVVLKHNNGPYTWPPNPGQTAPRSSP
jgi:hypothetical protein